MTDKQAHTALAVARRTGRRYARRGALLRPDDIASACLERIAAGFDVYDPATPFVAFARHMARLAAVDYVRRITHSRSGRDTRRRVFTSADLMAPAADPRLYDPLARAAADAPRPDGSDDMTPEAARVVADALATLPAPQRRALRLRFWDGLTYDRLGTATGAAPATARWRMNATLADLRARFETAGLGASDLYRS